ncbi:MAG: helicase C-terminal domain-containing protein [Nitrososphaerales archaeon]
MKQPLKDRPWQQKVSERAVKSIRGGRTVLLDAPTGSGKSLIALEVGNELLESRYVDRVYIGMRTINEMSPFERDIRQFYGGNLDYTYFIGKRRSCPFYAEGDDNGKKLCEACLQTGENDQATLGTPRRRVDSAKIRNLVKEEGFFLNDLQKRYVRADISEEDNICLFHSVKEMPANFTLLTYPYIFSPKVRKSIELDSLLGSSLLIIDEAHNAEDITSMFERKLWIDRIGRISASVSKIAEQGILWIEPREVNEIEEALSEISSIVLEFADVEGKSTYREKDALVARLADVSDGISKIRRMSSAIQKVRVELLKRKASMSLIADPFSSLLAFIDELDDDSLELFSDGADAIVLRVVDPAVVLSILNEARGLMLMSGTMPGEDYVKKVWAIGKDTEAISVEREYAQEYYSVFPKDARRFELDSSVTSTYARRTASTWEKYAEIVEDAYSQTGSNVLVCCPSYDLAEKISQHLKSPLIVERKGTAHAEVASKLSEGKHIVMSVARGKLLEGVEFTANGLSLIDTVVIAGIPYAVPDEYHDYRARRILARLGIGEEDENFSRIKFEYFSKQPALVTVKQAIGRAVRSPGDRARIILADSRFASDFFWTSGLGLD